MSIDILLTGSSGYIGSRLAPKLSERNYILRGVDREDAKVKGLESFIHGDLCDPAVARKGVADVDQVLHLAAAKDDWGLTREEYFRDNLGATKTLIEAGRKHGVKNWIFYSTVAVLGPSEEPLDEEAELNPVIPYGESKAEAEKLFYQLAEDNPEASILIIRPSAVFGPGNPPCTNIYRLIDAIYNRRFMMIGEGNALKTTSHLENLIQATLFLMERMQPGVQIYNYVDYPVLTTRELVRRIYRYLGRSEPSFSLPLDLVKPVAKMSDIAADLTGIDFPITADRIEKFCTPTNFDASAIRELGFEQPVSNEEALRATVEWHLEHEYGELVKVPA
jgi:nucleoside-diphosphate-sugar epimerase